MSRQETNQAVQTLLEENHIVFDMLSYGGGHPNMDYADYVAYASLADFRRALQRPDMTRCDLEVLLRRAYRHVDRRQAGRRRNDWSACMADYVARNAEEPGTAVHSALQ